MQWQTSRRKISLACPLVMGILNVTPDSFSDGGRFLAVDDALRKAEAMIADGADILDVGGESTRPGSKPVRPDEEVNRVVPVIEAISKRFDLPVSVDTTKSQVASRALDAGAEIINDISGLRWAPSIAELAAKTGAGLVLMHSRGDFETMHSKPPVADIVEEVTNGLRHSINKARSHGVGDDHIVLDPGIGFGKTPEQNLELLAKLDKLVSEFENYPFLVGASRKSFLRELLGDVRVDERLSGSLAAGLVSVQKGAKIVRVHDVKETVSAIRTAAAICAAK
jgi:dihydropteroate synthase